MNLVEMLADENECIYDQSCYYGHRVIGHAVYCHNYAWKGSPRKCRRSHFTGGEIKDEDCKGFKPNTRLK